MNNINDQQMENNPKQRLSQISRDEVDIINDIRDLNFGRINITIQDGVIISKEITRIVKRSKNRNNNNNNNNNNKRIFIEHRNVVSNNDEYNRDDMY